MSHAAAKSRPYARAVCALLAAAGLFLAGPSAAAWAAPSEDDPQWLNDEIAGSGTEPEVSGSDPSSSPSPSPSSLPQPSSESSDSSLEPLPDSSAPTSEPTSPPPASVVQVLPVSSWDSPALGPGDGSAGLVYSPQIQAELAEIRTVLSFGAALIVMLMTAQLIAKR